MRGRKSLSVAEVPPGPQRANIFCITVGDIEPDHVLSVILYHASPAAPTTVFMDSLGSRVNEWKDRFLHLSITDSETMEGAFRLITV